MVILQAVSLQSLSDFMVRKIEANLKDQPTPANTANSPRSKCYDFLKYKNQKFEIIEDAKDKAYEFIRNVLRLKIDTKICERQELVQTLMCLMAVSNNLNALFKDRLRILAPLVVILNTTLSQLMDDYKSCLNQLTLWPNIIDPFALGPSFVTREQQHTDRPECTHTEAFIDITTGEVVTIPCNKTLDKNFYHTSPKKS